MRLRELVTLGDGIEAHDQNDTQARAHAAHLARPVRSAWRTFGPGPWPWAGHRAASGPLHQDGCHDQE